jgi:TolB-like protein
VSPTSSSQSGDLKFDIGHVLFIDIVGYSKGLISEQSESLQKLKEIVRGTEQFRMAEAEGKLLRLPTGDGGALVFRNSPEAPVLCAMEIARALKTHPALRVRMGIHSGPVNEISDLNEQANIAGAGINIAQRVMDCGDAGHILLSRHVAEDLEHYPRWQAQLHELGECEVKHGVRISVVNLYNDELGNPAVPERFVNASKAKPGSVVLRSRRGYSVIAVAIGGLIVICALLAWKLMRPGTHLYLEGGAPATPNAEGLALHGKSATGARPSIPEKSIAVLPFDNLSDEKSNAYFAEGIQDEILTRLSKIAALKVISRTSTQKYKSAPDNLREVGQQLGVANLLEGSVQKAGNAVHINVQLIKAATDEHLWAESYDRELQNIFGVEGEVASAIAEQLKAKLSGAEQKAVADEPTENLAAYDDYLRGLAIETSRTDDNAWVEAAALFDKATQLDPRFAVAWARLAIVRSILYFSGTDPAQNTADAVKDAADKALALKPELGEAMVAQGVYFYRVLRDFPKARDYDETALQRLPNSSLVLEQLALVERRLGRWTEAEEHFRKAAELDPRNVEILSNLADTFRSLRKFSDARDTADRILQISPGNEGALVTKIRSFQYEGRINDAAVTVDKLPTNSREVNSWVIRMFQLAFERRFEEDISLIKNSALSTYRDDGRTSSYLGWVQIWANHKEEARATFEHAINLFKPMPDAVVPVDSREFPCYLALTYAGLGEKEKALDEARRAVTDYKDDFLSRPTAEQILAQIEAYFGDADSAIAAIPHLLEVPEGITPALLRLDPFWDPLRKDPRFDHLCKDQTK